MLRAIHQKTINEYLVVRDTGLREHIVARCDNMAEALHMAEAIARASNLSPDYYYIDYRQTNRYTVEKY